MASFEFYHLQVGARKVSAKFLAIKTFFLVSKNVLLLFANKVSESIKLPTFSNILEATLSSGRSVLKDYVRETI